MASKDLFGEMLRKWRVEQKIRVSDLADMLGTSSAGVSDLEWGYKRPDLYQIDLLAKWMELPIEIVLRGAALPPVPRPDYTQLVKDVEEGRTPGFISYAHDPEAEVCRCNDCRMARDWEAEQAEQEVTQEPGQLGRKED